MYDETLAETVRYYKQTLGGQEYMGITLDEWLEMGKAEGKAEGRSEGILENLFQNLQSGFVKKNV